MFSYLAQRSVKISYSRNYFSEMFNCLKTADSGRTLRRQMPARTQAAGTCSVSTTSRIFTPMRASTTLTT